MKVSDKTTTTYFVGDDFFVDISVSGKYVESFLYHNDYGIKVLMFGSELGTEYVPDYDSFLNLVDANLDEYVRIFIEEYFD